MLKKITRSFQVIYTDSTGIIVTEGRFCGNKPIQVACKALSAIYDSYQPNFPNRRLTIIKDQICAISVIIILLTIIIIVIFYLQNLN